MTLALTILAASLLFCAGWALRYVFPSGHREPWKQGARDDRDRLAEVK